jgi:hypothetical protein
VHDADCGADTRSRFFHYVMGPLLSSRSKKRELRIDNSDSMRRLSHSINESVPGSLSILHYEKSQNLARVQNTCLTPNSAQEIQIYLLYLDDILLSFANRIYSVALTIRGR